MSGQTPNVFDVKRAPLKQVTLVEASAGTGKTFSIKHLVLRLIVEENIPVDKILVMTFTVAATAELKHRIEEHLRAVRMLLLLDEKARAGEDKLLLDQIALWKGNPQIGEESLILKRVERSLALLDRANILTIHSFCHKVLGDRAFSAGTVVNGDLMTDSRSLAEQVAEDFFLEEIHEEVKKGSNGEIFFKDGQPVSLSSFTALLKLLVSNPEELVPRVFENALNTPEDKLLRRFVKEAPAKLKAIKADRGVYTYDDLILSTWEALRKTGYKGGALEESIDFARGVREDYQAVLIDEFQDTDALQLDIVDRLFFGPKEKADALTARDLAPKGNEGARELLIPSLFFVGDPKQAIYRFRGADLLVYLSLKKRLHSDSLAALTTNFRSSENMVEALNAFFLPQSAGAGAGSAFINPDLTYQAVTPNRHGAELFKLKEGVWSPAPVVELLGSIKPIGRTADLMTEDLINHLLEVIEEGVQKRLWIKCASSEAETPEVALPPEYQALSIRPVEPGDIAVLARSNEALETMRRALTERGVRTQIERKDDICATPEATEIRYVLRAIEKAGDDGPQRLALATRLFGFSANEIGEMSETKKSELRSLFLEARRLWTNVGVAAAFKSLFEANHTVARLLPSLDGEEVLTNYAHLIELLHANGQHYKTPSGLMERFEAMMQEERDDRAPRLVANRGFVRLMTVHSSKGLEFPIVFIHQIGNWQDKADTGLGVRDIRKSAGGEERVLRLAYPELARAKGEKVVENLEEMARLIYVALTRARSQVVLSWHIRKKSDKKPDEWFGSVGKTAFWQMLKTKEGFPDANETTMQEAVNLWIANAPAKSIEWVDADSLPKLTRISPQGNKAASQMALAPTRASAIEREWRTWSFTGLSRLVQEPGSYPKYLPAALASGKKVPQEEALVDDEIRAFPRGAKPGECLHKMFEKADFALHGADTPEAEASRQALARETIESYLTLAPEVKEEALRAASEMIHHVLSTPMLPGLVLKDLPEGARSAETYFLIETAPTVTMEGLKEILCAMGQEYALQHLSSEALSGFLQGFIDLIFEFEGRYWILDWKSNVCGAALKTDFTEEVLDEEMTKHRYRLQYLIYSVALRRLMKARMGKHFNDEMIGGALYVFLRGVSKEHLQASGLAGGVVRDTTYPHYLGVLDDYLRGELPLKKALTKIADIRTQLAKREEEGREHG